MPKLPRLTDIERIKLENIMLHIQLIAEREDRIKLELANVKIERYRCNEELNRWKRKFNKKLAELNLTVDDVEIDAKTGEVNVINQPVKLHKELHKDVVK